MSAGPPAGGRYWAVWIRTRTEGSKIPRATVTPRPRIRSRERLLLPCQSVRTRVGRKGANRRSRGRRRSRSRGSGYSRADTASSGRELGTRGPASGGRQERSSLGPGDLQEATRRAAEGGESGVLIPVLKLKPKPEPARLSPADAPPRGRRRVPEESPGERGESGPRGPS